MRVDDAANLAEHTTQHVVAGRMGGWAEPAFNDIRDEIDLDHILRAH